MILKIDFMILKMILKIDWCYYCDDIINISDLNHDNDLID